VAILCGGNSRHRSFNARLYILLGALDQRVHRNVGQVNTKLHNLQHEGLRRSVRCCRTAILLGETPAVYAVTHARAFLLTHWRRVPASGVTSEHVMCSGYIPVLCELLRCVVVIYEWTAAFGRALLARAHGYSGYVSRRVRAWLAMQL
jgi:hypothetical protein